MGSTITQPFVKSIRRHGFAGADFSAMDEGDKRIGDDAGAAFRRRLDLEPAEQEPLPKAGVVKWFDAKKGFGFIVDELGRDVFVHYSVIEGTGYRKLNDSEKVHYAAVVKGDRLCATCVRRIEHGNPGFVPASESPEG